MLSFSNTAIAFSAQSDKELRKSYLLFKLISYPILLKIGKPLLNLALWLHLPIQGLIKATIFDHFCGGENLAEAEKTIAHLAENKVKSIPDYSVEGKESAADFDRVMYEVIEVIKVAKQNPNIPFAVFKPTGIGRFEILEKMNRKERLSEIEEFESMQIHDRMDLICKTAHDAGVRVMIDAEESWIQDAADMLAEEMMKTYNREKSIVFNTIQMYRHDRLNFLKQSLERAQQENWFPGFKIVRGAYMEKERDRAEKIDYPSPIHATKADVDRDYNLALDACLEQFPKVAIFAGTHNEESCMHLATKITEKKIARNDERIWFSQLFGMSDNISFNLASEGFNVAKYIPYGPVKDVVPYLVRRAEENTSVAGQTGRELNLISSEIARRKKRN